MKCSCPDLEASVKEGVRGRREKEAMATRQTHDQMFKQEAVRLVQTSRKSQRQITDHLGIGWSGDQ